MTDKAWQAETLHDDFQTAFLATDVLYDTATEHQRLVLFENPTYGRVLMLDGATQLTTADEFVYHEMMAHTPILAHGVAKDILIVGGGDGGVAREVLRHSTVERLVQVEIDDSVVAFSRQYLPEISAGAFDDPRHELVIADGARFMAETERRFDVIIVDSTDPIGPAQVLFTEAFYADCRRALKEDGILITQSGVPFIQGEELEAGARDLRASFADVWCYLCTVPTYVGGEMALGWASDQPAHRRVPLEVLEVRYEAAGLVGKTRYYAPDLHQAAFVLPPYIKRLVIG
ncbi:MAG: polyamine aminopropyltransferase [Pseudomonadota bacterium]